MKFANNLMGSRMLRFPKFKGLGGKLRLSLFAATMAENMEQILKSFNQRAAEAEVANPNALLLLLSNRKYCCRCLGSLAFFHWELMILQILYNLSYFMFHGFSIFWEFFQSIIFISVETNWSVCDSDIILWLIGCILDANWFFFLVFVEFLIILIFS